MIIGTVGETPESSYSVIGVSPGLNEGTAVRWRSGTSRRLATGGVSGRWGAGEAVDTQLWCRCIWLSSERWIRATNAHLRLRRKMPQIYRWAAVLIRYTAGHLGFGSNDVGWMGRTLLSAVGQTAQVNQHWAELATARYAWTGIIEAFVDTRSRAISFVNAPVRRSVMFCYDPDLAFATLSIEIVFGTPS